ncbi:MAG: MFS transporter [Chitinophagaceae bacterium]
MYRKNLIFTAACISIFLFRAGLITLGSIIPELQKKFDLDQVAAGVLFSLLPLGILTGSLIFGPIADRYGYRLVLAIACLCMFAGFEGIAYADTMLVLKICVYLFGTGGGAINGGTSAVIADISKSKGSALSLLGVFFGLGALFMPFILASLQNTLSFGTVLATVGFITLLPALFFLVLDFPVPKQTNNQPLFSSIALLKDHVLLLIAFFLFCQSSFEGIINNWTTSYLIQHLSVPPDKALYALTLYLAGMTVSRLLIGTVFSSLNSFKLLFVSFILILAGCILLETGAAYKMAVSGLVLLGAGLGGGFPLLLGLVANRYTTLSGTAFSFVLVIALVGNMLVSYEWVYLLIPTESII